jgi:Tfp pilus assembly protein PilV
MPFMFRRQQSGFSLLGVIVAVFIISIGLMGILNLANYALQSSYQGEAGTIASGLAQEGIEMVRYMRSMNIDWVNWYSSVGNGDYRVQFNNNSFLPFADVPLNVDPTTGLYQYGGSVSSDSIYYRRINIQKLSADEMKVIAEVKWQTKGVWHSLLVEDRLWEWQ